MTATAAARLIRARLNVSDLGRTKGGINGLSLLDHGVELPATTWGEQGEESQPRNSGPVVRYSAATRTGLPWMASEYQPLALAGTEDGESDDLVAIIPDNDIVVG